MSSLKIDTGGGNVLDCIQVVEDVVMKHGDEIDAVCWQRLKPRLTPDRDRVARAICAACGENPEHTGDAQGNDKRWQDYLEVADRYINAMGEP